VFTIKVPTGPDLRPGSDLLEPPEDLFWTPLKYTEYQFLALSYVFGREFNSVTAMYTHIRLFLGVQNDLKSLFLTPFLGLLGINTQRIVKSEILGFPKPVPKKCHFSRF